MDNQKEIISFTFRGVDKGIRFYDLAKDHTRLQFLLIDKAFGIYAIGTFDVTRIEETLTLTTTLSLNVKLYNSLVNEVLDYVKDFSKTYIDYLTR